MMLLISGNLNSEETDSKPRKHFCTLCHSPEGKLLKVQSHGGQRTDFICLPCVVSEGKLKIQALLEDMPLPHDRVLRFRKKEVAVSDLMPSNKGQGCHSPAPAAKVEG